MEQGKKSALGQLKKPRITEAEQEILKHSFKEREDLLLLIRDLFFGFNLTSQEKATLKETFSSPELRRVVKKVFLPKIERGIPIGESIDLWTTVQLSSDEVANDFNIEARQKTVAMFETALALLENINGSVVNLTENGNATSLLARASFIASTEARLNDIWIMANREEEDENARKTRLAKNSMK